MNLCKDCKHYREMVYGIWPFKIRAPHLAKCAQSIEPVSGEPAQFCEIKRRGDCGPVGKFWEGK